MEKIHDVPRYVLCTLKNTLLGAVHFYNKFSQIGMDVNLLKHKWFELVQGTNLYNFSLNWHVN